MAFKDAKRCKARSKTTGKQCKNPAVKGFDVCRMHGAHTDGSKRPGRKPGSKKPPGSGGSPPEGNTNAMKHGAYSPRLPPEELPVYEEILARYMKDVHEPSETDKMTLERLAIYETKLRVAVEQGGSPDALDVLDRLLNRNLKALRVTRESKGAVPSTGTTPAEVVGKLLAQIRERQALAAQESEQDDVIEAEVVEVQIHDPSDED